MFENASESSRKHYYDTYPNYRYLFENTEPPNKIQRIGNITGEPESKKPRISKLANPTTPQNSSQSSISDSDEVSSSQDPDTSGSSYRPSSSQSSSVSSNSVSSTSTISDSPEINTDMSGTKLPGTGMPSGDNGKPGSDEYYLPIERTSFGQRNSVYRKTFQIVSDCFLSTIVEAGADPVTALYLTSELLEIPWHLPCMYMSPSEYAILNPGSHAKKLRCKIYFRGATVKFETNSSSTQLATLNTVQTLRAATGLNLTGWGQNMFYSTKEPTDPMIPLTVDQPTYTNTLGRLYTLPQELYGFPDRTNEPGSYITGNFWIGRNYWCESSPVPLNNSNIGWPTARTEKCHTWDAKTMLNKCIVDEEYNPNVAPLVAPLRFRRDAIPQLSSGGFVVDTSGNIPGMRTGTYSESSGITSIAENTTTPTSQVPNFDILTPIEKSQNIRVGPWGQHSPKAQPSIHVGVQAMPQLGSISHTTGVYSGLVQASAYFDVHFEMEVSNEEPTHFNYLGSANIPAGEELFSSGTYSTQTLATYAGLYS